MQTAVNLAGAITMISVGGLAAWYRAKGRAVRVRPAPLPVMAGTDSD